LPAMMLPVFVGPSGTVRFSLVIERFGAGPSPEAD
jgi:hypothetical protein